MNDANNAGALAPKVRLLLQMVQSANGQIDASDHQNSLLNYFCDDNGPETDTFNIAIKSGFIRVTHDSHFETSTAYLTDVGREAALSTPNAPEAGVVAQLRAISGYPIFRDFGDGAAATTSLRTAADLLESQAKALSEVEAEVARLAKRLDLLAVGFGVPDGGKYIADWQTKIAKHKSALAAEARLSEAMKVIEPFTNACLPFTLNGDCTMIPASAVEAARAFTNAAKEKT